MNEIRNKNKNIRIYKYENHPLILLFWLKIFFGIVGGTTHYFIQRILFFSGSFNVHYLLRGLFINGVIFAYISFIHFLIVFTLIVLRRKFQKLIPRDENVWRFSVRFSFIFIVVFMISASLTFYIGF
ncbi:MAG: hypothetical protein ACFFCY_01200 [Promethearchaeota archaeon]